MTSHITPASAVSPALRRPGFRHVLKVLARWQALRQQRRALAGLETHHLRDLGLTPEEARREALRPFWDGPSYWR